MIGAFLILVISTLLFLAIFGKSLGTRRIYVKALLKVFEFARTITTAHREELNRQTQFTLGGDSEDSEEEDEEEDDDEGFPGDEIDFSSAPTLPPKEARNGAPKTLLHKGAVISRKDNLILNPDGSSTTSLVKPEKDLNSNTEPSAFFESRRNLSADTFQRVFQLNDVLDYVKTGMASIIEDEVTKRFVAEELKTWNLLTRTSQSFEFINVKLTVIWILGFFVRYFVLLPGRLFIFIIALINMCLCMFLIGNMPECSLKKSLYYHTYTHCFELLGGAVSAVITYHNPENMPGGGICVANHTSPLDVLVLACDNAYALIGQRHGGFMGMVQNILGKASSHIWFEREVSKDRLVVVNRLSEHVNDSKKLPILIFPEGTCINNTSVMQFKKGSFEVGGTIYPVAIKYDPLFGDAFWNSSKHGMLHYIFRMMTSWAIVCDVWYLPPMKREEEEDAIAFANRVKRTIAKQGGLVDLVWDGNLKRKEVKSEWKAKQQEDFSKRFKFE